MKWPVALPHIAASVAFGVFSIGIAWAAEDQPSRDILAQAQSSSRRNGFRRIRKDPEVTGWARSTTKHRASPAITRADRGEPAQPA